MKLSAKFTSSILLSLLMVSTGCFANWTLNNDKSNLSFVSVKKSSVVEVHHFSELSGVVSDKTGKANIEIDLTSVKTMIPIRDERLQSLLFHTSMYPKALISADINLANVNKLKTGESFNTTQDLTLELHGIKNKLTVDIQVTKLINNKINVSSVKPVILKAADFKLVEGINALRDIAGLPSITTQVPVTFNLAFDNVK